MGLFPFASTAFRVIKAMIQFTSSQFTLLQMLGDGACHSGNLLGQALGISRSAIWKHMNQLIDLGIPIQRIPQQGYKLPNPMIFLDEPLLTSALQKKGLSLPFNIQLFASVDSTNRYLKDKPASPSLDICCAEIQTQGRGRFGRYWHSPFGENIYCSSRWSLGCDLSRLSGLSLITSLAVLKTINDFNPSPDIQIKWPNDILWGNKKLCGSLIEIIAESNSHAQVIIGVGLNVNTDTKNHPLPDKPWCSLYEISQQRYNRNDLIAQLIINLERYILRFLNTDLNEFTAEWSQHDYLAGKFVTVAQSLTTISGIARGISSTGLLIIEDEQGEIHYLSSGDTSLSLHNVGWG